MCAKDMVVNWTDIEVFHLIGSWSEVGIQEQLEGCKQYKHIYVRLSTLLEERNINKTGEQRRTDKGEETLPRIQEDQR